MSPGLVLDDKLCNAKLLVSVATDASLAGTGSTCDGACEGAVVDIAGPGLTTGAAIEDTGAAGVADDAVVVGPAGTSSSSRE